MISINIATQPSRLEQLKRTVESLYNQADVIRIYLNGFKKIPKLPNPDGKITYTQGEDLTDNGKFYFLKEQAKDEYYFTCDDDIIYPSDYIEKTKELIDKFNCIVTYHGRILKEGCETYYGCHEEFRFHETILNNMWIDVAGTGVCGFHTSYFKPKIWNTQHNRMSDIVFSLEARKQNKKIMLASHSQNWMRAQVVDSSIFSDRGNQEEQVMLIKELLLL
jgi:hypothetical protein